MDINFEKAVEAVRKIVFEPRGIVETDEPELLEQTDDDGGLWENIVHYISKEDHRKLMDEELEKGGLVKGLPEVPGFTFEYSPFFELDRGTYVLGKPAICFYSNPLDDEDFDEDEDEEDMEERKTIEDVYEDTTIEELANSDFNWGTEDGEFENDLRREEELLRDLDWEISGWVKVRNELGDIPVIEGEEAGYLVKLDNGSHFGFVVDNGGGSSAPIVVSAEELEQIINDDEEDW